MDKMTRVSPRLALGTMILAASMAVAQTKEILVLRPNGATFEEARKGILETLGPTYHLSDVVVTKETQPDEIGKAWKKLPPQAVVAMDNRSIALFREARAALGDSVVPVVALMGVRVDAALKGVPNAAAINYEIPAVTTLVNLRSVVPSTVKKVGMVYRASMEDLFQRNAQFCKAENIELVGRKVADDADPKDGLKGALEDLAEKDKIQALVVVNDNFFLNAKLLKEVWLPTLSSWKMPVIVGVESLVKPELKFGNFAILPDHYALGAQAAGLIQEIEDAGWKVEGARADQPLSVIKVLNLRGMKSCCGVQDGKINEIDKVLE